MGKKNLGLTSRIRESESLFAEEGGGWGRVTGLEPRLPLLASSLCRIDSSLSLSRAATAPSRAVQIRMRRISYAKQFRRIRSAHKFDLKKSRVDCSYAQSLAGGRLSPF